MTELPSYIKKFGQDANNLTISVSVLIFVVTILKTKCPETGHLE